MARDAGGARNGLMLAPASARELADLVRGAHDRGEPLRPQGAGTWLAAGHAVPGATPVSLAAIRGIVAYTPDDLTMTVEAGTTLAELDEATRAHGQWCPLLPWGGDRGTVGATIATATAGPFAATLGRPRDLVLGLDAVDGTGRLISGGGRVVKNVAGFDLTRTFTGSWGTLAILTRLHLRLRARPAVDECWTLSPRSAASAASPQLEDAARSLMRSGLAPLACEGLHEGEAAALGLGGARYLVRIGGNSSLNAATRAALAAVGAAERVDPDRWDRLREVRDPHATATQWRWDALSRRLKCRFDPRRVLNPGLLGDEP